ncbi:hypothetical protein [Propionibacterium freudenreichii]|uniref:hypothetical protein n=1 Tax=Propionibacterium freudenreichii TaxID=1744 RepID=UPI002434617A|nr:hypothetical protein [Propionibacterium freudenreichii]MDK9342789.1 hypothetical protein [Propionibacterium freudenreichii]MDK9627026.1 hypothetical protein [Propionibacterium freudenreichii]WFF32410.1 hypothetical protein FAM19024_001873 [Propionibacterium freudenreichii]
MTRDTNEFIPNEDGIGKIGDAISAQVSEIINNAIDEARGAGLPVQDAAKMALDRLEKAGVTGGSLSAMVDAMKKSGY